MTVNLHPIERIYPDDKRVKPQTIAHHKARYEFAANRPIEGAKIRALDLGSGTGYGLDRLRKAGYHTVGVEIDAGAIKFSRENYPKVSSFIHAPLEDLIWGGGKVDLITFFEVIEHLTKENAEKVLTEASRILNKGGALIMSVPRDINADNNGFHKSNWPFEELKATLESKFKRVLMLGQDWDTAEFSNIGVEKNDFYIAVCTNG